MMATDVGQFFQELDGGVFEQKLGEAIHEACKGAVGFEKAASITVKLDIKRLGKSHQVNVAHKIVSTVPTMRGKMTEEETTETPMHVGKNGVTLFPENQYQMLDRQGQPTKQQTGAE
jgi:hypothetical protein